MERIAVIGTTGSGKTQFAKRLAERLGFPHVELDRLHWDPDWTPKPIEELRALVDQATQGSQWICDGNYSIVRDLVWTRADTIVWLNYSFPVVFSRAVRRTLVRCLTGKKLYADNQETLGKAFASRDSILLWVLQTHWKHRKNYPELFQEPKWSHLKVIQLKNAKDTKRFLARL